MAYMYLYLLHNVRIDLLPGYISAETGCLSEPLDPDEWRPPPSEDTETHDSYCSQSNVHSTVVIQRYTERWHCMGQNGWFTFTGRVFLSRMTRPKSITDCIWETAFSMRLSIKFSLWKGNVNDFSNSTIRAMHPPQLSSTNGHLTRTIARSVCFRTTSLTRSFH